MANLMIKKFNVKYEGERYGPGDIMYDVPADLAKKLVEESNGTIVEIPKQGEKRNLNSGTRRGAKNVQQEAPLAAPATEPAGDLLAPVDPNATVK
jgi:hypothetical protein